MRRSSRPTRSSSAGQQRAAVRSNRRPPELRERVLAAVGAAVDGFGGTVVLDLRTTLVLARRPA
ncbi:hypothetical protein GA0074695_3106 [Micromonospora viridifaciens]|uniref:Uncharacterized protein n=1 Tax=Micromonospora viridifaciens TaxID=1881 RepID=A0A1C4X8X5_MICVI|nr:hypothetical protein GA0074695_3106 [Micromonospora viridifaciens]